MEFLKVTLRLLEGFFLSSSLFFVTLVIALPLGLIFSFGSMSKVKPIQYVLKFFVWIIRGTPLMLQLFVVYYGSSYIFQISLTEFEAACIAFTINYAAYFSEIYRGGIESIPRGQYEAGQVLGMTKTQVFFKVVLLQVFKRILPPISNEIITLVKDTALANTIGLMEIMFAAREFGGEGLIWPLFYTAVFYLVFNGILSILFGWLEKKMDYYKG